MPSEYSAFLEEGERVDHVIKALAGMNRWMALLLAAIIGLGVSLLLSSFTRLYARRLILVTDRAVVLLAGSRFTFKPTALLDRLPVDTPLGPLQGLWLQLQLGEHKLYVSARSIRTVSKVETERRDGERP